MNNRDLYFSSVTFDQLIAMLVSEAENAKLLGEVLPSVATGEEDIVYIEYDPRPPKKTQRHKARQPYYIQQGRKRS